MKVRKSEDGSTEVLNDSRFLARFFLAGCLIFSARAIYHILVGTTANESFSGSIGAAGFFFVAYLAIYEDSRFSFDKSRRTVIWQRRTLFSRKSGVVPFSQVDAVLAEALADSDGSVTRRLALRTKNGVIPFSRAYTGDPDGEMIRVAADLNGLFGHQPAAEVKSAIEEMLDAGREIDAVRMIRAERGTSLSMAREEVTRLKAGIAASQETTLDTDKEYLAKKLPSSAIVALGRGSKIDAIKSVRLAHGLGLQAAKALVDEYLRIHTDVAHRLATVRSEKNRSRLSLMLLIAVVILLAYYFLGH
jgi:ribosomal protein L7/L12